MITDPAEQDFTWKLGLELQHFPVERTFFQATWKGKEHGSTLLRENFVLSRAYKAKANFFHSETDYILIISFH